MDGPDAEVIARSEGDPAVFAAVFDRHAASVFRFLVRRVEPSAADGLLGEVFRVAFEQRYRFDPSRTSARPWLYGIATNLVAKHYRGETRRWRAIAQAAARRPCEVDMADRVAEVVDAGELWPRLAEAIAALPDRERDTLLLFAWEELSYDEIAAALGVPVGTVRSRLNRSRHRLRELTPPGGVRPRPAHRATEERISP